jgi:hypothetical protein
MFCSVLDQNGRHADGSLNSIIGLTKARTRSLLKGDLRGFEPGDLIGFTAKIIAHNFFLSRRIIDG